VVKTASLWTMYRARDIWARRAFHLIQAITAGAAVASLFLTGELARDALLVAAVTACFTYVVSVYAGRFVIDTMEGRLELLNQSRETAQQVEELFAMTDMLQAAEAHEDAGAVLMATALRLLPEYSGALYVFNNSRDRLDLAKAWNLNEGFEPADTLLPSNCWALKRGKPHINDRSAGTLCCMHQIGSAATVEVPDALIEARAREMWDSMLHSLSHQGIDRATYLRLSGTTEEETIEKAKPDADVALRREAVLAAIAEAESLDPSEEEMLEAVTEVSGQERVKPEKLLERLRKNGRLDSLKDDLSQRKAWDLVAESAKPVPATASDS
jgi:hypothetical protein